MCRMLFLGSMIVNAWQIKWSEKFVFWELPFKRERGSYKHKLFVYLLTKMVHLDVWTDPDRGGDPDPPPPPKKKNHKSIGFLSNTGSDPLNNHKATKPAFNVGPSSTWRSTGGPMMIHL